MLRGKLAGLVAIGLAILTARQGRGGDDNWPQFRGPTGLGYTDEKNLPLTWGGQNGENVRWKSPLVGEGHASPIVWGDRALRLDRLLAAGGQGAGEGHPPASRVVLCGHATASGCGTTQVPPGPWLRNDFRSGPGGGYACPTPTTDGKLVYCVFGSVGLAAWTSRARSCGARRSSPTPSTSPSAAAPCSTRTR